MFDGKVERSVATEGTQGVRLYRAITSFLPTPTLMTVPCGVCPVSYHACVYWFYVCECSAVFLCNIICGTVDRFLYTVSYFRLVLL